MLLQNSIILFNSCQHITEFGIVHFCSIIQVEFNILVSCVGE